MPPRRVQKSNFKYIGKILKIFYLKTGLYEITVQALQNSVNLKLLKLRPPNYEWGPKVSLKFNIEVQMYIGKRTTMLRLVILL